MTKKIEISTKIQYKQEIAEANKRRYEERKLKRKLKKEEEK